MNHSVESLQREIKNLQKQIKVAKGDEQLSLKYKMKELLDSLHLKKFKSRQQLIVKKIKDAEHDKEEEIKNPEPIIKYLIKEVPKEIIKEVPVIEHIEVIREVPVYIATKDGGLPKSLTPEQFVALNKEIENIYISSNTSFVVDDIVETTEGMGIIKEQFIDPLDFRKKHKGIFAKVKKFKKSDGVESARFTGSDRRGYAITLLKFIEHKEVPDKKTIKKK